MRVLNPMREKENDSTYRGEGMEDNCCVHGLSKRSLRVKTLNELSRRVEVVSEFPMGRRSVASVA